MREGCARRSAAEYLLCFMFYALIGWLYETVLEVLIYRWGFSNRGVLFGPWLPVYGAGGVMFLFLWYPALNGKTRAEKLRRLPLVFLQTMLSATLLELLTSYLCEWSMGSWPWQTYSRDYAVHFQGRIALSPSLRFGLGGVVFLYLLQPMLDRLLRSLGERQLRRAAFAVLAVLAADVLATLLL